MSDRRFTREEIEFVARLQARPVSSPPRVSFRAAEGAVFALLVSTDIAVWLLVALRGAREMLGAA